MSQHDYDIANASGATVRADLNGVLAAIISQNAGATEPAVKYPFMVWPDTTANQLKIRNGNNSGWVVFGTLDIANLGLATLASPTLTGIPKAPTPDSDDDTTQIATTAMVQAAAAALIADINTVTVNLDGTTTAGRTIYVDTDAPSAGANGDVWLEY